MGCHTELYKFYLCKINKNSWQKQIGGKIFTNPSAD